MSPQYIPYTENTVSLTEVSKGTVLAAFNNGVSGYTIDKYLADDHSGYVYHLTAWNSIWNKKILKSTSPAIVLNPNGEEVTAVYYYSTDGGEDLLIYGQDQNPDGGVVTLPRLFLTYYALYAAIFAIICLILLILLRKNETAKNIMMKLLFVPIAYLLSHLFLKGFISSSYSATHDFFTILLIMFPLYCTLLIATRLLKHQKVK